MNKLADIRIDYSKKQLDRSHVSDSPLDQFETWFEEALQSKVQEVNAMHLSTVSTEGMPSGRIVLLKGIEEGGFVFFTNYDSRKGWELKQNPQVALTFFWPELERQVRIEGLCSKVSEITSDQYFKSRPRGSQIGAWVSPQSQRISSREFLEKRLMETEERFNDSEVERPPHWGGYKVTPNWMEFWQGRPSRLHDRIAYRLVNDQWTIDRLAP